MDKSNYDQYDYSSYVQDFSIDPSNMPFLDSNIDLALNSSFASSTSIITATVAPQMVSTSGLISTSSIITTTIAPQMMSMSSLISSAANSPSSNSSSSGNVVEFTKRRNWSQRIIDEIQDFLHVLSPSGRLMYCSPSSSQLVGYAPEELIGRNITDFLHVDDIDVFVREYKGAINNDQEFKVYYRFRRKDESYVVFEVIGHPYFSQGATIAKCFFATGQLYPSKASAVIDSFLELKVENEILRRKLRRIKSSSHSSEDIVETSTIIDSPTVLAEVPPFNIDDNQSTCSNLAYPNNIHMTTAVDEFSRFDFGERIDQGISATSPRDRLLAATNALVDLGMLEFSEFDPPASKDPLNLGDAISSSMSSSVNGSRDSSPKRRSIGKSKKDKGKKGVGRRHKKMKLDEYICSDCGRTESPEWRKGPNGKKTLCNACGLRWAKRNKKEAAAAAAAMEAAGTVGGRDTLGDWKNSADEEEEEDL